MVSNVPDNGISERVRLGKALVKAHKLAIDEKNAEEAASLLGDLEFLAVFPYMTPLLIDSLSTAISNRFLQAVAVGDDLGSDATLEELKAVRSRCWKSRLTFGRLEAALKESTLSTLREERYELSDRLHRELREFHESSPTRAYFDLLKGIHRHWLEKGEVDRAQPSLNELRSQASSDQGAIDYLGGAIVNRHYYALVRKDESEAAAAIDEFRSLISEHPLSIGLRVDYRRILGNEIWWLNRLGKMPEAANVLREILAQESVEEDDATVGEHWGKFGKDALIAAFRVDDELGGRLVKRLATFAQRDPGFSRKLGEFVPQALEAVGALGDRGAQHAMLEQLRESFRDFSDGRVALARCLTQQLFHADSIDPSQAWATIDELRALAKSDPNNEELFHSLSWTLAWCHSAALAGDAVEDAQNLFTALRRLAEERASIDYVVARLGYAMRDLYCHRLNSEPLEACKPLEEEALSLVAQHQGDDSFQAIAFSIIASRSYYEARDGNFVLARLSIEELDKFDGLDLAKHNLLSGKARALGAVAHFAGKAERFDDAMTMNRGLQSMLDLWPGNWEVCSAAVEAAVSSGYYFARADRVDETRMLLAMIRAIAEEFPGKPVAQDLAKALYNAAIFSLKADRFEEGMSLLRELTSMGKNADAESVVCDHLVVALHDAGYYLPKAKLWSETRENMEELRSLALRRPQNEDTRTRFTGVLRNASQFAAKVGEFDLSTEWQVDLFCYMAEHPGIRGANSKNAECLFYCVYYFAQAGRFRDVDAIVDTAQQLMDEDPTDFEIRLGMAKALQNVVFFAMKLEDREVAIRMSTRLVDLLTVCPPGGDFEKIREEIAQYRAKLGLQ